VLMVGAMLWATAASAQQAFTGLASISVGAAHGGDVAERATTISGASAVVEESGWGAELDFSYAMDFAGVGFADSDVSSGMINVLWMRPEPRWRPFVSGGVGIMRVRASIFEGVVAASTTDAAMNAGGGLLVVFNDIVGVRGDVRYFRYFQTHAGLPLVNSGPFDAWRTTIGVTYSWPMR